MSQEEMVGTLEEGYETDKRKDAKKGMKKYICVADD